MTRSRLQGNILLFITALIWGAAFVAQKIGVVHLGVFTFTAVRFLISGVALLPLAILRGRRQNTEIAEPTHSADTKARHKYLWIGGVLCGLFLMFATVTQQVGLTSTTAGKAGFITALYILFVPLLRLFGGKKASAVVWISVLAGVAGLYLLCVKEDFSVDKGDLMVLLCALVFSGHILIVDKVSPHTDCVRMSCIQFFVASAIAAVPMLIFEKPDIQVILSSWAPLLYLGVVSGGIGYTLQILGQKNTEPTVASLIMSLEAVFAAVSGVLFLQERFIAKELVGCILMFAAIIVSQINFRDLMFRFKKGNPRNKGFPGGF